MKNVEIPAGQVESNSEVLGTLEIATIFVPAFSENDTKPIPVQIYGSHDGKNFGPIIRAESGEHLEFLIEPFYYSLVFDPQLFEGVQYFKFILESPLSEDVKFFVHLKNF